MRMKGFSIVELMVALLLGSLIALAATQLFLVNRQTENLQQGLASVQDQGRMALDYVSRDLMQAGHDPLNAIPPFVFSGDSNKVSDDATKYDVVAFQMNDGFDCVGNSPYSGVKKYWVDDHGLKCTYWAASGHQTSGTIIDGVEAFQVQYGVDYDKSGEPGFGQPDVYTDAAGAKTLLEADANKQVVSARFALLLSSTGKVATDTEFTPASVQVLDHTYATGTGSTQVNLADGRLYRVFTATVAMRNQNSEI